MVWTGVLVSPDGEILTTTEGLGDAPIVRMELWDGTRGHACVTGRDDGTGLALLAPLAEPRDYHFLELSGESPAIGDQVRLFQHSTHTESLDEGIMLVVGKTSFDNGYSYSQLGTLDDTTADGAVLTSTAAHIQGIRMPSSWLLRHEIGNRGEVYAVDASGVAGLALPLLRSGHILIGLPLPDHIANRPPSGAPVFRGYITLGGKPAPSGSVLHVRVSKEGLPDYWESTTTTEGGYYLLFVNYPRIQYLGAVIEFWMNCTTTSKTVPVENAPASSTRVDLDF